MFKKMCIGYMTFSFTY
uniref:Uncharacterized protein n=1 Tax=Arundo donax TaxID=35708 RepID=A0A0A8Y9U4_ARUDO